MVKHRSTLQILFHILNVAWGALFVGYSMSYFNAATDTIKVQFSIESHEDAIVGMLNALFPIGAAIGALASAQFLSMLSMRHSIMASDLIGTFGCLLQLNFSLSSLIPARLIIGFAVGLNSAIVPQYINQFSPVYMNGSLGALNHITINMGILIALTTGIGFNSAGTRSAYLRGVFVIPIFMCVIRSLLLTLVFKDEPPKYYLFIGKPEEAKRVLIKLYEDKHVEEIFNEMNLQTQGEAKEKYSYKDMIMTDMRPRVLVGCGLATLQQLSLGQIFDTDRTSRIPIFFLIRQRTDVFSFIFVLQFMTQIFLKPNQRRSEFLDQLVFLILDGGLAFFQYHNIFKDYYPENKLYLNIGVGATNCLFSLLAIPVVNRYGRRFLLLYGTTLISIILSVQALMSHFVSHSIIHSPIIVILLIFLFLAVFQFSLGPVLWIYITDILPHKGVSIAVLPKWISLAIIAQVFPILSHSGLDLCFLIFAIICLIGIAFIYFYVPEVKGKTHTEIEEAFATQYKIVSATTV